MLIHEWMSQPQFCNDDSRVCYVTRHRFESIKKQIRDASNCIQLQSMHTGDSFPTILLSFFLLNEHHSFPFFFLTRLTRFYAILFQPCFIHFHAILLTHFTHLFPVSFSKAFYSILRDFLTCFIHGCTISPTRFTYLYFQARKVGKHSKILLSNRVMHFKLLCPLFVSVQRELHYFLESRSGIGEKLCNTRNFPRYVELRNLISFVIIHI